MTAKPSPLIDSLTRYMSVRRYSSRTIGAYLYWIKYCLVRRQMSSARKREAGGEALSRA